ncbi:hypothetical protein [Spiroplasma endosymbiont of Nebria brevicollis]|uniref:hypothetical protein n=1 Tax=Spiroplasma endosymbiont of Nebria brevicollis TaxID=3066284 RepID=UPI00313EB3AC
MTRMEKYQSVRNQIAQDIKDNANIWQQEQMLENYRQKLMKIDKEYFTAIFKDLNHELNLINFETHLLTTNDEKLKDNDKYVLEKMLVDINNTLEHFTTKVVNEPSSLDDINPEYKTLITSMHNKIVEFQTHLESKISDVRLFIKSLETKYQKHKLNVRDFKQGLIEINDQHNNFQDELQKIKTKNNYKTSLTIFSIIICLVLVVTLILLLITYID